jgi:2-polyprenyl-3-methyl-5-hydroxy-6-metoxy-1,4-benzoquinol methylase
MSLREKRSINPVRDNLIATGLYHSFQLPDGRRLEGAIQYEFLLERWNSFQLPSNLAGKTALDIGPWDGFFTFALEQAGAQVTAVDYVDLDTFRALHRAFDSKARYLQNDVGIPGM